MMISRKLTTVVALVLAAALGACNLSQSGAAAEVALNPPTLEISATRTPISFNNPTRTPIAAPTITVLGVGGGDNTVAQPASQIVAVGVTATQPPPPNMCSLRPTGTFDVNVRLGPSTDSAIQTALKAGQYLQVVGRSDNGWLKVPLGGSGYGWVAAKVVTLNGPCNGLPVEGVSAVAAAMQVATSFTPTPTGMFGFTMNIALNHLITKVDVGSIPAGTTVMVTTTRFTGSEYLYDIVTADGRYETARDSQLAHSASGGTLLFPTPTPVVIITTATNSVPYVPTQTAVYNTEIGMGVYRVMTTTALGTIPTGTAVRISSAMFNGTEWTYWIATKDGTSATARESQLAYIPNAGGGGPTPTVPVVATLTIPVMSLATDVSPSDVVIPDDMCTVTANSTTNLYAQPGSSTVVGILNPGPWSQVDATDGKGWYKVTIWTNGSQGWTNTSTVTLHGPCDKLPVE